MYYVIENGAYFYLKKIIKNKFKNKVRDFVKNIDWKKLVDLGFRKNPHRDSFYHLTGYFS